MKSFTFAATAALASTASARIVGLAAPATIAPNSQIPITLITENYIQSVKDLSAAFALTPQIFDGGYLGTTYLGSFYLGPDLSNVVKNITFTVTAPSDLTGVKYLTGAVNSLYGVSNGASTIEFAVPVTVGTSTSTEENSDTTGIAGNCFASSSSSKRDSCFPASTSSSIQSSLTIANNLVNDVYQNKSQAGHQDLGELQGYLNDVFKAVDLSSKGEGACNNPTTPDWPSHLSPADSQARAIDMLRQTQDGLNALQGDVNECNVDPTFKLACELLSLVDQVEEYPW